MLLYKKLLLMTFGTTYVDTFQKLKEISAQYGLIVNGQKTKYFRCTMKIYNLGELQINSMYTEQVQSYNYFGSL